ncbi:MAG: hypothetical protein R2839_13115 [Thermomicrobiales bacterium]
MLSNPIGVVGLIIVLVTVIIAVFAPDTPYSPSSIAFPRLQPPSLDHLMGTDEQGRATPSRESSMAQWSRCRLASSPSSSLSSGGLLGVIAGYFGGRLDSFLMRIVDIPFAFPGLVLAIVIAGLLGPSRRNASDCHRCRFRPGVRSRRARDRAFGDERAIYRGGTRGGLGEPAVDTVARAAEIFAPLIVLVTVYLSSAILSEAGLELFRTRHPASGTNLGRHAECSPHLHGDPALHGHFPGIGHRYSGARFQLLRDGLRDVLDPRMRER